MMSHPFIDTGNLESKTVDELSDCVAKLTKSLNYVQATRNYPLANQLQLALNSYRGELNRRQAEMFKSSERRTGGRIDIS